MWRESLKLGWDLGEYWFKRSPFTSTADDLRTLALHVLTGAGFGKHFPFEGHEERKDTSVSSNYKNALQVILENCILIMGLGPATLARLRPFLPKSWKLAVLADACAAFQRYMTEMYEEEKNKQATTDSDSESSTTAPRTLMSSLVRASQADGVGLTEREMYGNMFMLNFAGHDTTAHTLTFAMFFLAAHPEVSRRVSEEVRAVIPSYMGLPLSGWDYARDFPRLVRCQTVMLETLRLYTPIPVAKWTNKGSPTLNIGGRDVVLPPNMMVIPSYSALHTDPAIWGEDSLKWRPSRWIKESRNRPGEEELITPREGAFLGWSEGARHCPAKKFSQVEFVATIAVLMRDWRVDPVPLEGEDAAQARRRVQKAIEEDCGAVLLLQMLHPERIPLEWSRRTEYYLKSKSAKW